MKEDIKEYLIVNNLLTEEKLANHILELRRNTVVKPILHKLVDLLYNKKPVLLSFFAEKNKPKGILNFTEIEQNTIPKKEQEKLIKRHIKKSNTMFLDEFLERVEKQNNTDALSKAAQQRFKDLSLYVNLCNEDDILESLPNYEQWSTNTTKTFNKMSDRVKNDSDKCGILESMEFPFDLEQKEKKIFEDWDKPSAVRNGTGDYTFNNLRVNTTYKIQSEDDNIGINEVKIGEKKNKNKPQLSLLFKQFPKALEAIARCSEYGHLKYKETDSDYLNYTRVEGGSKTYADAGLRHRLEEGNDLESGLPHQFHVAWNALAELQIWIIENNNG